MVCTLFTGEILFHVDGGIFSLMVPRTSAIARTSHQLSAAATYPSALTALRSVGPLDGLHEYACASLGLRASCYHLEI